MKIDESNFTDQNLFNYYDSQRLKLLGDIQICLIHRSNNNLFMPTFDFFYQNIIIKRLIVDQQRVVLQRSTRAVFCIDGSKLNRQAPHFLVQWERVDALVTDVSTERLAHAGIILQDAQRAPKGRGLPGMRKASAPENAPSSEPDADEMPIHIL